MILPDFKIFAVDFDGTLCENKWPEIGTPNQTLIDRLFEEKARGNKIILWTCRTHEMLLEAVTWCHDQGLIFDAVNENIPEIIALYGEDGRKVTADWYIDDHNMSIIDGYAVSLPYYERKNCFYKKSGACWYPDRPMDCVGEDRCGLYRPMNG